MAFEVGNFLNKASQTVAQRASGIAERKLSGVLGDASGAVGLGLAVLTSGASAQTIRSVVSMKLDQFLNGKADEFFKHLGIGGVNKERGPLNALIAKNPQKWIAEGSYDPDSAARVLIYPADLGTAGYSMRLKFSRYSRPSLTSRPDTIPTKFINLPLPRELSVSHSSTITSESFGILGSLINMGGAVAGGNKAAAIEDAATQGSLYVANRALALASPLMSMAGIDSDRAMNAIEQGVGAVMNPHLSAVYEGPNLREMNYTWEFSPNNPEESLHLKEIIEQIQQRSLASFAFENGKSLLAYPEIVEIEFTPDSLAQIVKHKKMMIKSVNVQYSPNGIPSFFAGTKLPTFVGLSISLHEIEYFTSQDYGGKERGLSPDAKAFIEKLKTLPTDLVSGVGAIASGKLPPSEQKTPTAKAPPANLIGPRE